MTKKRILMIIPGLDFGGAQRVFKNVAVGLSSQNEIFECAFNLDTAGNYVTNNPLYSLHVPGGRNVFEKLYYFFLRVRRLRKLKRALKIDASISHLEGADYVNILSDVGEKIILCVHGSKLHDKAIQGLQGYLRKRFLIPILYRKAHAIIAVAEGIGVELEKFGIRKEKIAVINNGVDSNKIKTLSKEPIDIRFQNIFSRPVLITHGRIAVEKNQRLLLEVASQQTLRGKLHTVLIGDGPLYNYLVEYSRARGLSTFSSKESLPIEDHHRVFFLGYMSNPFPFITRSTVFGFPSLFEGFPMALLEAMACGVPVLASDCPYGPADIVRPGEGFLLDKPSKKGMTQIEIDNWVMAIKRLLEDDQFRTKIASAALRRIDDFSENNVDEWQNLLNRILIGSKF